MSTPSQALLYLDVTRVTQLRVSVIITTFNRKNMAIRCIEAVRNSTEKDLELTVVDDCSSDGTFDTLRMTFPFITLIRNEKEMFVGASRNRGAQSSRGNILVFIDDDVFVDSDSISNLADFITRHKSVGIAGGLVMKTSGEFHQAGMSRVGFISVPYKYSDVLKAEKSGNPLLCDSVFGDFFAVKRDVMEKLGGFDDENFPQMNTEFDFCRRAARLGYKIVVTTCAVARTEQVPASGKQVRISRLSPLPHLTVKRLHDLAKSGIIIQRKHFSGRLRRALTPVYSLVPMAYYLFNIIRQPGDRVPKAKAYMLGVRDGFRHVIHE